MRKFEIGDTVKIEIGRMLVGKIIDKRYKWIFTEYAVESMYERFTDSPTLHIDWMSAGSICKYSDTYSTI